MLMGTLIAIFLAILLSVSDVASYSKYGRSCNDIGCLSNEECVMAEDPCTLHKRDSCGRYPTCQKKSNAESCTTKVCPVGHYCKFNNGIPTCVSSTAGLAFDSAGISSVNGQRLPTGSNSPSVPADPVHSNPYAKANAPPADEVNSGHNNGYPQNPNMNNNRPGVLVDEYGYPIRPPTQQHPNSNNRYPNMYPLPDLTQNNFDWVKSFSKKNHGRNTASNSHVSMLLIVSSVVLSDLGLRFVKS